MQAPVLPFALAEGPADPSGDTPASRLAVFDDPEEWAIFSQSCDKPAVAATGLWESQVIVQGMHCAACSLTLEQALLGVRGVVAAQVSAASKRASVVWSAALTRPSQWMAVPQALGYRLLPASDAFAPDHGRKEARLALWRWLVAGFCMMQVMMYAVPAYVAGPGEITPDIEKLLRWASWVLTLPVVLFSCGPFFGHALRDLKQRSISMDLPVALGIAMTFAISTAATFGPQGWWGHEVYFDSLTMFVFFLLTGRWLEQRLRDRTAGSLDRLMQRLPDSVQRQQAGGRFERVAARRLKPGDLIRVLPGEAFPADGTIVAGDTFADEALLTGESRPVARPAGASVLAGSYNLSAPVQVRIDQTGQATRYAQIVALMERASVDKPRLALLADRVAKPFLWFVLLASAMAAAYWWRTDPARAVMAAVAVLIVTCPCALSLATPSAMLTSAGLLARQGVLVRRLQALESLATIDTVVFVKTRTQTAPPQGLG
jgi:Cu2+-exporting ATPase